MTERAAAGERAPLATRPPHAPSSGRRPVQLAVMTGAAAGLYAVTLAGVTALQASTDASLAAARDPIAAAIAEQRITHDLLDAAVEEAAASYEAAGERYAALLATLSDHGTELAVLERAVAAAEGTAANLVVPARPALPSVRSTVNVRPAPAPPTNASTGASGGG